jgi:hypothetical protein
MRETTSHRELPRAPRSCRFHGVCPAHRPKLTIVAERALEFLCLDLLRTTALPRRDRRKLTLERIETHGGDDGARTRDLRRDRPAF